MMYELNGEWYVSSQQKVAGKWYNVTAWTGSFDPKEAGIEELLDTAEVVAVVDDDGRRVSSVGLNIDLRDILVSAKDMFRNLEFLNKGGYGQILGQMAPGSF